MAKKSKSNAKSHASKRGGRKHSSSSSGSGMPANMKMVLMALFIMGLVAGIITVLYKIFYKPSTTSAAQSGGGAGGSGGGVTQKPTPPPPDGCEYVGKQLICKNTMIKILGNDGGEFFLERNPTNGRAILRKGQGSATDRTLEVVKFKESYYFRHPATGTVLVEDDDAQGGYYGSRFKFQDETTLFMPDKDYPVSAPVEKKRPLEIWFAPSGNGVLIQGGFPGVLGMEDEGESMLELTAVSGRMYTDIKTWYFDRIV